MYLDRVTHNLERLNRGLRWTALGLTLGVAGFWNFDYWVPPSPLAANTGAESAAWAPALFETIAMTEVQQRIRGRAVFRTLRVMPRKVVNEIGRYRLEGVFKRADAYRAWVRDQEKESTITLSEGDVLGGIFEVISIDGNGVTLRRGAEEQVLTYR